MKTQFFDFTESIDPEKLAEVGSILRSGGIVGIPTETVYGLAADALNGEAVKKIFLAKGRPMDNPLIVHITCLEEWAPLVREIPDRAMRLAKAYWPGPMTIILPKSDKIPDEVSGNLDTVAVRMPSHPVAAAVIRAAGTPLAAPSANLSRKPSPTTAAHVMSDLDGRVDAVVDGGECSVGVESTVVTLAGEVPRLLRPGGITPRQLTDVLGELEIDKAVCNKLEEGAVAASPGMKYLHYSPNAEVVLVRGSLEKFARYVESNADSDTVAMCFDGEQDKIPVRCITYGSRDDRSSQAHDVFLVLRELDDLGIRKAYVRCPDTDGVGLAVYNRLIRAAGFNVVEL